MTANLSIVLKKASKIYHEGDMVSGVAVVESSCDLRHEGLTLAMEGFVNLQLSTKNVGIFEAFSNSIKPITLLSTSIELASPGKIPAGVTEIPFEMPLRPRQATSPGYPGLLETYHGVFVNIMYTLKCSMRRSFLNKPLHASCQFFVQHPQQEPAPLKPVRCEITPATVRGPAGAGAGTGPRAAMPQFQVYAEIDSTVCALDRPLTGKIRVDECSVPIKSIELQLVRVETCGCAEGYSKDATEIQNIQIGDGDVCRARDLPLHMVLPRLFTCPTTTTSYFKIEFELNIAVIFEDGYLVTENFPILLLRSRRTHVNEVATSLRSAPTLSLRARAAALHVPRTTLRTILHKDLAHILPSNEGARKKSTAKSSLKKVKNQRVKKAVPGSAPPPCACLPQPVLGYT